MVTTGHPLLGSRTTEILNLGPQEAPVPTYQNYSKNTSCATGGWVGDQFIVCGGLGCASLCSDVPKVKFFICSPSDPLIWFTRFPK